MKKILLPGVFLLCVTFIQATEVPFQKAESENAEENIQGRELKYAFLHSSSGME